MTARSLALVLGMLYLGLGVLGLMPGTLVGPLATLLPVHPALAFVHLGMGAWGLAAYMGAGGAGRAHSYARSAAFIFAALGLAGLLDGMERFFMPLHGANAWLHLATAGLAGFVAWRPRSGERRSLAGDRRRSRASFTLERRHGTFDRRKAPAPA